MGSRLTDTNTFIHSGTVSKIDGSSIVVSLDKNVHCESCHAKGACGVSDSVCKQIMVDSKEAFQLNEPVEVLLKKNLGHKAVFWAYIFPFILMLLTLLTASFFFAEWIAGVLSLLILVPYYIWLHALNNYFKETFKISILKLNRA
ncbi:MAG: SoxR reducing system RseC family protein [Allomuricauda sp.]